ncbi:MAG: hypothetical protein ACXAD7_11195 [Candidatus Kariarchaeaceae archaeon]|jgi:DNA-binding response OmpR family regulator
MSTDPDDLFSEDIDSLFKKSESSVKVGDKSNILLVGSQSTYKKIETALRSTSEYTVVHVSNVDDSIALLLVDIFGIVIIDNDCENIDAVTVSRLVRINHPLARIIVVSKRRGSALVANIVNHGSVEAFLTHPFSADNIQIMISEQQAKHEISKMLAHFVSQPPKLSKASYLLLDPSLAFTDETEPVKFVGIMIAYESIPRYSHFFEEFLAKDEILFAGYLSGIAMLGRQLFDNKEPLKEINFGGVSVILRFHEDIQISTFVRNLTRHNVEKAEETISDIISQILAKHSHEIEDINLISENVYNSINSIVQSLEEKNASAHLQETKLSHHDMVQTILLIGSDKKKHEKIKNFLERRHQIRVKAFLHEDKAYKYLNSQNCEVLILDSKLRSNVDPLTVAEVAKEISPSLQTIYLIRDRRASSPLIEALNSGVINSILPYKETFRELSKWALRSLEKAVEIRERSVSGEGISQTLDQATIARTIIRKNPELYNPESKPELHGIFISKDIKPIFQIFWTDDRTGQTINFDTEMMAGLVASLDNIGEEMFSEQEGVGKLELGGADILVKHREAYNFAFFVKNVDPNTSIVVNKEIKEGCNNLYKVIENVKQPLESSKIQAQFDTISNQFYSLFTEKFTE